MHAPVSILRVTDTRTHLHTDVKHIDAKNFTDGSTPSDEALTKILELMPKNSPPIVNCEEGIGRSAVLWLAKTVENHIDHENGSGRYVSVGQVCEKAVELAELVRGVRGDALLPDLTQNAAVMRYVLKLQKGQKVVPAAAAGA